MVNTENPVTLPMQYQAPPAICPDVKPNTILPTMIASISQFE
uniref:Uncharacterized protein n=1 Tax=Rhizophora mucronata TaxID=61149 RepID=A0A2P2Q4D5_RHIMU